MKQLNASRLRPLLRPAALWTALAGALHVVWHVLVPASFLAHEGALAVAVGGALAYRGAVSLRDRRRATVEEAG